MNTAEIEELLFVLDGEMRNFSYFPDRYAIQLLAWTLEAQGPLSVGQLKQHPFGKFLNKPLLKQLSAHHQRWDAELLQTYWPEQFRSFEITFGQWGNPKDWDRYWNQSCRRGANLVVQVNFSEEHDEAHHRFKKAGGGLWHNMSCHPIRKGGRHTLAWSRIDIDWETGEALIEEIQSDWVTSLLDSRKWYEGLKQRRRRNNLEVEEYDQRRMDRLKKYLEALHFEVKYWPEMTLYAALEVLRDQLGIKRIWYHTPGSGNLVKRMGKYSGAPKSHYTTLPRRFGFQRVSEWPEFIEKGWGTRRKKIREKCDLLEWNLLEVE